MWNALRAIGSESEVEREEEDGLAEDMEGREKQRKRTQKVLATIVGCEVLGIYQIMEEVLTDGVERGVGRKDG